jgi:hypothetical protein
MTESRQFEQGKEQKPVISDAARQQAGFGPEKWPGKWRCLVDRLICPQEIGDEEARYRWQG